MYGTTQIDNGTENWTTDMLISLLSDLLDEEKNHSCVYLWETLSCKLIKTSNWLNSFIWVSFSLQFFNWCYFFIFWSYLFYQNSINFYLELRFNLLLSILRLLLSSKNTCCAVLINCMNWLIVVFNFTIIVANTMYFRECEIEKVSFFLHSSYLAKTFQF